MKKIYNMHVNVQILQEQGNVGRRIKIFLGLKADGKIVVIDTFVASFAKVLCVNKS